MSGAIAAHVAYNGSGTQGLAVTNKIHESDGNVMSVFWNKNDTTRQLLYGSSIIEIPSSGASTLNYGSSKLFTVNEDIDCLGDIYLQIGENFDFQITSLTSINIGPVQITNPSVPTGNITVNGISPFILDLIDRIEVQVGTQIWQTLEHQDLYVLTTSELEPGAFTETISNGSKFNTPLFIRIPCLTKTLGPQLSKFTQQTEDGYPMAAAPHQSVKFKVYFADTATKFTTINDNTNDILFIAINIKDINGNAKTRYDSIDAGDTFDIIIGKDSVVAEVFFIIPGYSVTTGDSVYYSDYFGNFQTLSDVCTVSISTPANISSCKMYAKQQIMCNEEREQMRAMPMGLPKRLKMTQNAYLSGISGTSVTIDLDHFSLYASHLLITTTTSNNNSYGYIETAELKLNSSSFSGALPGTLLFSATNDSLGVYCNRNISEIYDILYPMGKYTFYTFPLAATAYSGSSVPLNRFDSIRLTITFFNSQSDTTVSVTCVGETTALFKDGAASLAMY